MLCLEFWPSWHLSDIHVGEIKHQDCMKVIFVVVNLGGTGRADAKWNASLEFDALLHRD